MPKVNILSSIITPSILKYGNIAKLSIKVKNNYTRNKTVTVKVTTTGFEFTNLLQSKRWKEEQTVELNFPLGRVWVDSQEQLSVYIEVKDGKFTEDDGFAITPPIEKIDKDTEVKPNIHSIEAYDENYFR